MSCSEITVMLFWKAAAASLLPVLLAGAGPFGLVDHLGHAGRHGSGHVSEAGVEGGAAAHNAAAVGRVPGVVAVGPRQQVGHGHEEVVEGDADDHVVVDADVGGHHHHAVAHTWRTFGVATAYKMDLTFYADGFKHCLLLGCILPWLMLHKDWFECLCNFCIVCNFFVTVTVSMCWNSVVSPNWDYLNTI